MSERMELPVVEIFGPTIQGEGPAAGVNAVFLRFGGCNLSCSWCDTPYSWDGARYDLRQEITQRSVLDIMGALPDAHLVVLTGGEPLLHQHNPAWTVLIEQLSARYPLVHVETNGTIEPVGITRTRVQQFTVSPKLANAGAHRGNQNPEIALHWHHLPKAILKFVVTCADEVDDALYYGVRIGFPRHRIWVMPEGVSADRLNALWPEVAQRAAELGINATHRLHVLAWLNERGH